MPDALDSQPIEELLESRSDLWRGRHRPAGDVLASGRAELDRWLPAGGWPCGRLVELLPERFGIGEFGLLLPMLAKQTRRGLPVLLVSPPWVPCPQHLERVGVALEQLVVIRSADQALWATEQGLKSGLCGAILLWHSPSRVRPQAIRRLQLAAECGPAPVFVCYRPGQQPPPSLASLRLGIRPGPELTLLRGNDRSKVLHLGRSNVVPLSTRDMVPTCSRDKPERSNRTAGRGYIPDGRR
jgi:protein ImuA